MGATVGSGFLGTEYAPVAASWAEGVYCASEYFPTLGEAVPCPEELAPGFTGPLKGAVLCEVTREFGNVRTVDAEPCVSWLSVSSAKRA